jgi:hypothetical protein
MDGISRITSTASQAKSARECLWRHKSAYGVARRPWHYENAYGIRFLSTFGCFADIVII